MTTATMEPKSHRRLTKVTDRIIYEDIENITRSIGHDFQELAGKTVMIVGANGFIPSYFVDTVLFLNQNILSRKPVKLILLTRREVDKNSRISHCLDNPDVKFVAGDVTKVLLPWTENVDIVIYGASKASPRDYLANPFQTAEVNVFGTQRLLHFCFANKVSRFLFISSGEIYGNPDRNNIPIRESYAGGVDPIGPRSAYQESKRFAETLCRLYWQSKGVDTIIARLFHTYGPRMFLDDGRVIPEFIKRALSNDALEVVGNTNYTRTFSYISDSVEGMWRILLKGQPGQAYNVGSEEEVSIFELAKKIVRISNGNSEIKVIPGSSLPCSIATPIATLPSVEKLKKLGWAAKVNLEIGLERLMDWYRYYNSN